VSLPRGWAEATLGDLSELVTSGSRGWAQYYADRGAAFIRIQNIQRGKVQLDLAEVQYVSPPVGAEGERTRLRYNDVLISITADLGRIGLFDGTFPAYINQHVALVRLREPQLAPFVARYLTSVSGQQDLGLMDRGITRAGLGLDDIRAVPIPLAPLTEQRRIVAKLDVLTAGLARARAELERVPILVRRMKHQALIACFAGAGQSERELGALLLRIESGKNMRCEERPPRDGELGVVKVSAVTWGRFDPDESKTLPPDYSPPEKARIRAGDLLFSRANTLELVGAVVLVDSEPNGLFLSDKILRLVVEEDAKRWILWFLRSSFGRSQIENLATGNQFSMRNISQDALRRIRFPFPPAEIRRQLIKKVESAFARADHLEAEAARTCALFDRLEAAILAKAFRGELVPQDPNDEPVSILLERIRAAHSQQAQSKPKRGRKASLPKAPREKAVMTKSRQDEDVKNRPYLADIIREAGGWSKVEDLFSKADLPVTDFYKQLAWEVDQGHIHDQNNQTLQAA
jgi:type I restriction enzyme S subunit